MQINLRSLKSNPAISLLSDVVCIAASFYVLAYTGRFISFSVITDIYNNNNCSQPQENCFFFDN
jgi:hypothetical protein